MSMIRYALCAWGGFLHWPWKEWSVLFFVECLEPKYHFVSECFEFDAILDDMNEIF